MNFTKAALLAALATTTICVFPTSARADATPECNNASGIGSPETTLECGSDSTVSGSLGTAVGGNTNAAVEATAVGFNASAAAAGTAVGISAEASAETSTALGAGAKATGQNSVALGGESVADEDNIVSVGSDSLQRRITNVADGVSATDAATVGQVQSADTALQGQISDLGSRHDAHGTRLDMLEGATLDIRQDLRQLDERLAGSTAVAIAMGGAAFLPGKRMNLTGNVATYDGAVAGAVQVGALVSDSFAVNAGVATNFNKRGKVGARVGFSMGW